MADIKLHSPSVKGKLKLPEESASKVLQVNASGELESSTVTDTELSYVSGVTSSIQSQLGTKASTTDLTTHTSNTSNPHNTTKAQVGLGNVDNTSDADKPVSTAQATAIALKIDTTQKGVANGVASLDSNGLIPTNQLPPSAIERLVIVADQAARFALTTSNVQNGDTVKQTDTGLMYYIKDETNLSNASGYEAYTAAAASTVAWSGITGIPAPVSALTGTNTGDQTATTVPNTPAGTVAATTVQAAINELDTEKAPKASPAFTGTVTGITKAMVGLTNVDDTSDATKNAATATLTNKTISASSNTISNIATTNLAAGVLNVSTTLASASNTQVPSALAVKTYVDTAAVAVVVGDIKPTSFNIANNQVAAANVTGFAFANATVRSFSAMAQVVISATTSLYETFELRGVQKNGVWDMSVMSTGDASGVTFTITNAGQIQYTSPNSAGYISSTVKFRADTLPL